jgi:hypothetical protein
MNPKYISVRFCCPWREIHMQKMSDSGKSVLTEGNMPFSQVGLKEQVTAMKTRSGFFLDLKAGGK